MVRFKVLVGGWAAIALGCGSVALAQEAAPPSGQPETVPVQQQAAQGCSGLGCLFGARQEPQPQAPPPAPDGQNAGAPPQPGTLVGAAADPAAPQDVAKPASKKVAKPVHVVTIAAAPTEVARLQRLASALPKEKIKIVKTTTDGDKAKSDFSVSTTLDPDQGDAQTKLFTEQMHIVAGPAIRSIEDLRGKVVSFGPDKTPSQMAARRAFAALNIAVTETPLDVDNALDGLATGDIAAVVMLAPQPIERLKSVSAPGAHLVSWPQGGSLPSGATAATIDAAAYPRLAKPGDTIRAMGVDATLTLSAKGAKQAAAKTFLKVLAQHSEALTKRGFDRLKADLDSRKGRHLASADHERLQ